MLLTNKSARAHGHCNIRRDYTHYAHTSESEGVNRVLCVCKAPTKHRATNVGAKCREREREREREKRRERERGLFGMAYKQHIVRT
jgi:hypothetical protein